MRMPKKEPAEEPEEDHLEFLLKRIRSGENTSAFEKLCERYANLLDSAVRQFAPSMGIGSDSASDLLGIGREELRQDAAVALYKAACSYIPEEAGKGGDVSFGLYAKICIRNAMITQVRRYNRMKKHAAKHRNTVQSETGMSDGQVLNEETVRLIQEKLSPYEKQILPLYLDGKPPREIAGMVGHTEKSVSNGIYRIKSKIRKILERN
ncbi:MAG: sigma-70 family RNA polymerase sigma factor [Ruminococcaceae bacterium]|nr:sigma-70 family RNA polymerase sigma factor [Oscillospiraceae bacterium]